MNTQDRQDKINGQVELAKKVNRPDGWVAVVTETRLHKNAKRSHFCFHFEKIEDAIIGRVIENYDGSVSKILVLA